MKRVFAIVALFLVILTGQTIDSRDNLPACATEDSDNCYWNADTMGNGHGRSFVVREGIVTYK